MSKMAVLDTHSYFNQSFYKMTSRQVSQLFTEYEKARLNFVQCVAEFASRPSCIEHLQQARALDLLLPLLNDPCRQVRQNTPIAIGRIVQSDEQSARNALNSNILAMLLHDFDGQNKYYRTGALFILRSLCKHNEELAGIVLSNGGLDTLLACLEDFEVTVRQGAAWCIGYIAGHSPDLAQKVVDACAIPLLVLCLQESELALKQMSANALADIAKHNETLAYSVVDGGAVPHLARNLNNHDDKFKRQILFALSSIAKHSAELAETVVEADIFPSVLLHMAHACPDVRRTAAALVRDVVKHTLQLAELVVNTGGIPALIELIQRECTDSQVAAITALGYISGHSDQLAITVLGNQGAMHLTRLLNECHCDATLAVSAWSLMQMGKHSPEHSRCVAEANALPRLLELYLSPTSSEDLKFKCKCCLKQVLQKCLVVPALEPLVTRAPPEILKYVLGQYSKILPEDPRARRLFVTSGALKKVQEIEATPGSTLMEYVQIINACFPEEIVRYYSPGYPENILDKVEQYSPKMMNILREARSSSDMEMGVTAVLQRSCFEA